VFFTRAVESEGRQDQRSEKEGNAVGYSWGLWAEQVRSEIFAL
jgi:hypothetical protein